MKYSLIEIREYALKLAEVISEVLRVDVEIVDVDYIRIAGTGRYRNKSCISIEGENFIYEKVIDTGKKQVVENPGFHKLCKECPKRNSCLEKFEYCTPIIADGDVIGVIALVCFSEEQKKIIIEKFKEYFNFLDKMSDLIAAKAKENYFNFLKLNKLNAASEEKNNNFTSIIGISSSVQKVKIEAKKVSKGNASILITGESGTGKELFAKAIHNESRRSDGPFIAINCAAIPETLLESELFGYATGAFTGASKNGRVGKFELASGGTIFLDEIGDMPLQFQVKLLRVLQDKAVIPVGSNKIRPVDVRIISATNRKLDDMVNQGLFREDLYYRLNVIPIEVPPLRKRIEDVPLLIRYFLEKYCASYGVNTPFISNDVMKKLMQYPWRGNVRELQNTVEYMVNLIQDEEIIEMSQIPERIRSFKKENNDEPLNLEKLEKKAIIRALDQYGRNTTDKKSAADALGVSLSTLYRKMEKYHIKR